MKILPITCMAVCLLSGIALAQESSTLAQTLEQKERSLLAAEQKKDVATLNQDLAADFTAVAVDSNVYDRREMLGYLGYLGFDVWPYRFKVIPVTEDAAIVSYDAVVKTSAHEDEISLPRYQHVSSLWVKQGDQWKLKFQQSTAARVED
jgi:hypothetical protein